MGAHVSDYCGVCGFDKPSCVCQKECEGNSDDCTLIATTRRDTSGGMLRAKRFCAACAADYDRFIDNYEPDDPDGEAFRGDESRGYLCERQEIARRFK